MDTGETLRFSSDLRDENSALANAASVTLSVTLPDGSTVTPTVTNPPAVTGKYFADYTPSQTGRHVGRWLFTLTGGNTTSYVETFDVGSALVTVDEAVAHLRANGIITSAADLEQLQWLCMVATDAVERDLGRALVKRTVVETFNGGGSIVLTSTPVVSVTSVYESGSALTGSDYLLNQAAGILYRGSSFYARAFLRGWQNVVVTYVAGYNDPPRIARKVALNVIQGAWQSSQQAAHPALQDFAEGAVFTAQGALTPVEQAAYDSLRAAGIA